MGDIDEFLSSLDEPERSLLTHGFDVARAAVPDTTEGRSYGMPALRLNGKPLVTFTATTNHCSLIPFSAAVVAAVAEALDGFSLSKGTIRFTAEHPVPDAIITRVVRLRATEISGA